MYSEKETREFKRIRNNQSKYQKNAYEKYLGIQQQTKALGK